MSNDKWGCTEICPYCDSENEYLFHDVSKNGYIVKCTHCGKEIFLCDACLHSDDNAAKHCDWKNNQCFRGKINK